MIQNGFVDVTIEAAVGVLIDFTIADRNFELTKAATNAAAAGLISEPDASRWLDDLHRADGDDLFLCSMVSFRAAGRKPENLTP